MHLHQLAKDPDSGYGGCQTVYVDQDSPDYCVVQGLDDVTPGAMVHVLPGERGVRIKTSILRDAVAALGGA